MPRILVQLATPGALPHQVRALLHAMGDPEVTPSHAELPGLYVVEAADDEHATALIEALTQLPAVRYAERESFGEAWS